MLIVAMPTASDAPPDISVCMPQAALWGPQIGEIVQW